MISRKKKTIKVILADDHELIREGFRYMLKKMSGIDLIGEASNGKELITLTNSLLPDIIITDINMPLLNGLEATRQILDEHTEIGIIALTIHDQQYLIEDMIAAGAKGYIMKNTSKQEIIKAINTVYNKGTYYCLHTAGKLEEKIPRIKPLRFSNKKREFNEREIEIIKHICLELTNKEIAVKLSMSSRTVEDYRDKLIKKMNVKNTAGIILYAIKNNMILP